jgi:hypothetical protein
VDDEPRSPREQFAHLLDAHVEPTLREIGFRRSGQTFRRREGPNWLVIDLQTSRYSRAEDLALTVNLGVASALLAAFYGRSDRSPTGADCHLQERLGPLVFDGRDHWWTLDRETARTDRTARTVTCHLLKTGVPFLEEHASDEAIRDCWLASKAHRMVHWHALTVLLHVLGPKRGVEYVLNEQRHRYKFNAEKLGGIEEHAQRLASFKPNLG